MKKIVSLILTLLILSTLCACNSDKGGKDVNNSSKITSTENENSSNNDSKNESSSKNSSVTENTPSEKENKIEKLKNAEWRKHPEDFKLIAFTFDDAPCYIDATNNNTVTIIDTLNRYEGAGTLFCVGRNIETHGTKLLQYALDSNFELANHSYGHQNLDSLTKREMRIEILTLNSILEEKFGVTPKFYRPANGRIDATGYRVTAEIGLPIIWSDISGIADYDPSTTPESIEYKIVNGVKDGSIVLLHGQSDGTAAAIENVCKRLYDQGYRFVTLTELFEFKGVDIKSLPCNEKINNALDYKQ